MEILKGILKLRKWKVEYFICSPSKSNIEYKSLMAITHGYTSHKGSLISWMFKLKDLGIPSILFDLPGHYLGSFNEIESFSEFKQYSHHLFPAAIKEITKRLRVSSTPNIILGGHSLGALLSIKALNLIGQEHNASSLSVGIGFSYSKTKSKHILETPFFSQGLKNYEQLVSPKLCSKNIFPWIAAEKENIEITNKRVHIISGENDFIINDGAIQFANHLRSKNNNITTKIVKNLPHHQPELAIGHIKQFIQSENL